MIRLHWLGNRLFKLTIFDISIVTVSIVLIGLGLWQHFKPKPAMVPLCVTTAINHQVALQGDAFSPRLVTASQCDTLTITNNDVMAYTLYFGVHDHHQQYPGYDPATLIHGETTTLTLYQAGQFELHDHLRDNAILYLHITANTSQK